MDPLVSVIIPCFNSSQYLGYSIESVLSQTFKNLECIVVDDGSTDNTKEVVRYFVNKDARVKYYYKKNGGVSSAKNYGLSKTVGIWIQILDADDWLLEAKLEKQIEVANILGGRSKNILIYSDYEIVCECSQNCPIADSKVVIGELSKKELMQKLVGRRLGLSEPAPLHTNSVLMSERIFNTNRFDENMVTCEDLDFFYRVLNTDVICKYVPIVGMCYRSNDAGISKSIKKLHRGYTAFLESIYSINKSDLEIFPNFRPLVESSLKNGCINSYNKLIAIIRKSKAPYYSIFMDKEFDMGWLIRFLSKIHILYFSIRFSMLVRRNSRRIYRKLVSIHG